MLLRNILFAAFLLCFLNGLTQAMENRFPKIGDKCPDFILNDVNSYTKKTINYSDFKGKPLIIIFMSTGCHANAISLPSLDQMQKEFKGKVQFLLIGLSTPFFNLGNTNQNYVKEQYEAYRNHYHMNFPIAYDTVLNEKFGVRFTPYTIWIDDQGIIRQITQAAALTSERIQRFVDGHSQQLRVMDNKGDIEMEDKGLQFYDYSKPFLINGNGGADSSFIYRSVLCKWDSRTGFYFDDYLSSNNKSGVRGRIDEIGVSLRLLYYLAYGDTVSFMAPRFGNAYFDRKIQNHYSEWSLTPILETSRKYLFDFDEFSGDHAFNYSLTVPDSLSDGKTLQQILQRELKNYFSLDATVETRIQPCWKLIVTDRNKVNQLKTKGGGPDWVDKFSGFGFKNQPMSAVLLWIYVYYQDDPTFIDETGIDFNIDIDLHCIMTDMNDIKRELRKNGLDLIKSEKPLKVVVIRDEKENL